MTAISSNISHRQWGGSRQNYEQSDQDRRVQKLRAYLAKIKKALPEQINRSYFFIRGKQEYNDHFQRVFKECFVEMRGREALVEEASRGLIREFESIPDICQRSEIELFHDDDIGHTHTLLNKKIQPNVEQRLRQILDSTRGLQQELLKLLLEERKKLHQNLSAKDVINPSLKTNDPLDVFATATTDFLFSFLCSNCSQVFKNLLSQLLQLMWLQEQIGLIEIPMIAQTLDTDSFKFNEVDYLVKKTNDDGACALHALLGRPIDGEYRYVGSDNVRAVFVERLKEQTAACPKIRTRVTNILISHLHTLDRSSAMLFDTPKGQALRSCYLLLQAHTSEFLRTNKDEECLIWQEQIEKPHIAKALLAAAKTNSRYANNSKAEILEQLQEHPGHIVSLVDESPGDFLRLLESPVYWKIVSLRSQRQNCMCDLETGKKVFAMTKLYPHYLEVIQRPEYFFTEQELELAAIIFEKKMVAVHLDQGQIIPITSPVHWEKEEAPIIIYHEGVHYSRCEPKSTDAQLTLYEDAQKEASALREKDQKKSERLISTTKNEISHLMLAGGVSLYRKDPFVISAQLFSSGANFFGTLFDPFNEKKPTSYAKMVVNAAGSLALGQPQEQVAKALIIDSFVSMTVPQNMSMPKNAAMTYLVTIIKSINDGQKKDELMRAFFGGVVSIGSIFPQKEDASFGERFVRIIFTNCAMQGLAQDALIETFTKKDNATTPTIEDVTEDTPEEISARAKMEAEIAAFKEELINIKEQGLEDAWVSKLLSQGKSSGGVEAERAKAGETFEPMTVEFDSPEPSHIIRQRIEEISKEIDQTTQELTKTDEVIRIGTEHLANLPASGEVVDNAHYEVIKKNGDWRVYRDGVELYAEGVNKSNSKAKKNCYKMIPSLKEKHGTPIPSQASDQATKALNIANDKKVALLQKLLNLQQQLSQKQCGSPTQEEIKVQNAEFEKRMQEDLIRTRVITQSREDVLQKEAGVNSAWCHLDDKMDDYSRHYKQDSYYSKLVKSIKNFNQKISDRDAAVNHYNALLGIPDRIETPKVEIPERASNWEKTKLWIDRNVEISINFSKSIPLYPTTPPSLTDRDVPPETPKESLYEAPIDQPKSSPYGLNFNISQELGSFDPNIPITVPNPFCPGLAKEITPSASTPKEPAPMKTPMYMSPSIIPPPMPPQFTNPFIPTEPGDLPPVSMPNIPPPERPTQTETTLVASTQTKGFGKKLLQATMDHFNKKGFIPNGSPIELGPRTQLMFLPTEATSQINRLAGFDPRIQLKYPEAYALASEIDKFGREKVTLLRVSMEEHERSRNQSELARTVKKVSVQVVKVWNNPRFQGSIQAAGGLAEAGLGAVVSIGSGGLAAPGGLALMAHGLDHYFTGMQTAFSGTHRDTVTVQALQGLGLSHNVSELVDTGISVGGGVGAGRALAVAPKMTMTRGLLVQEQMVKRVAAQKAFIERMNSPAYRSGLVSEGTVAKLAEKNVSQIRTDWVFPKKGGATINGRWYTEHALERMAPRTPEVMAELEVRALTRAAKKGYKPQTKDFGDWWKDHKPNPRNIPPSVVEAEIANPGSTNIRVELNKKGDVITVIPVGQK